MSLNETCSEGITVYYLSDVRVYPSKFCLKQKDVSALFRLKCAIVYGFGEVPANEKSLKLNEKLEILFCANDDNLVGENKHIVCEENKRGALLVARNEVSLVTKSEVKTGEIHNREVGKQVFLRFIYLGTTLTIRK